MSSIILISGPRGAGKTTYCNKCIKENPNFHLFSRDAVGKQFFGDNFFNPYIGASRYVFELLKEKLMRFNLLSQKKDITLLVDYWNGRNQDRMRLLQICSEYSQNVKLYIFTTPHDKCVEQFFQREGRDGGWNPSRDYLLYHELLKGVEDLGFSKIEYIDPTVPILF